MVVHVAPHALFRQIARLHWFVASAAMSLVSRLPLRFVSISCAFLAMTASIIMVVHVAPHALFRQIARLHWFVASAAMSLVSRLPLRTSLRLYRGQSMRKVIVRLLHLLEELLVTPLFLRMLVRVQLHGHAKVSLPDVFLRRQRHVRQLQCVAAGLHHGVKTLG